MKINPIDYDYSQTIPLTRDIEDLVLSTRADSVVDGTSDECRIINLNAKVSEYFEKKLALINATRYQKAVNKFKSESKAKKNVSESTASPKKVKKLVKKTNDKIKKINKKLKKSKKGLSYEISKQFRKVDKWIGKVENEFNKKIDL